MADRVGVISKGEIILVEDKAELMRKLGKKQLILHLHKKLDARAGRAWRAKSDARRRRHGAGLHLRHAGRAHRRHHAAGRAQPLGHPLPRSADDAKLARGHFRRTGERADNEPQGRPRNLRFRNGAHRAHHLAEHRVAGALDLAVFRGVRRGHRLAHHRDRGRALRRLHRAGTDHADAAHAEHDERLVRHLFPALHRHDLRNSVGAGVALRDRARLCRRGGDQVDHSRTDHPGDVLAVRAAAHRASGVDADLPGADGGDLQPARLHHRHLGRRLRASCRSFRCW